MNRLIECIVKNNTTNTPVWFMRQAGRYLPEFMEIRKKNTDFIKLCLNSDLASEITLQPIRRFGFDGAVIFSDILMVPYGMGQKVEFKKNFGPNLGDINLNEFLTLSEDDFTRKLLPVYDLLKKLKKSEELHNRDLIGFVGAPWTLLVYMINRVSPKNGLSKTFFNNKSLINNLLEALDKFIKAHIKNQVKAGATVIQIFDSWAGLINEDFEKYLYKPTTSLVEFVKELGVPVICFPRNIKNYKSFCEIVKPNAINIDYDVDPNQIINNIKIPVQGGMDPKILLTDKEVLAKETKKYLDIFKDHPYIFNLGHGILPETDPKMMDYLVKMIKDY